MSKRAITIGRVIDDVEIAAGQFTVTISDVHEEQLRASSLLPGWSRSHVIAHVALNAEGFVAVADAPDEQQPALMYAGGTTERDRNIAMLSEAPKDELVERFDEANTRFIAAWSPGPPDRACATAEGHPTFSSSTILQRRLRELQVHLVDLDLDDVRTDAWLPAFVNADLALQWPTVAQRTQESVTVVDEFGVVWETASSAIETKLHIVERRRLLGWVLDRCVVDGLPQLESWSNRSKWEWLSPDSQ